MLRAGRHQLSAMLEVLSPEDHAQYRAVKYTDASDGPKGQQKAKAEKRHEAMAIAAKVVADATLVPGF